MTLMDSRDYRNEEFVSAADLNHIADVLRALYRRSCANAYRTSDQEIGRSTWESLEIGHHRRFNRGRLVVKDEPTRMTLKDPGFWLTGGTVHFQDAASDGIGSQYARILKNGRFPIAHAGVIQEFDAAVRMTIFGGTLSKGEDWLELQAWQNTLESNDVVAANTYSPMLWGVHLARTDIKPGAWTAPPTWGSSDIPTATQLNALRDQLRYLLNPPHALIGEADTSTALTASTWTSATFDKVFTDSASLWAPANPTRLTIPSTGIYLVIGQVAISPPGTSGSFNYARLLLNGATVISQAGPYYGNNRYKGRVPTLTLRAFTAGDYVEVQGFHDASSTSLVPDPDYGPSLCAIRLGENTTAPAWADPVNLARLTTLTKTYLDSLSTALNYLHHPPACRVTRTTDQTGLADATWTTVLFGSGTEDFDTDNMHNTSTNTGRITFNDPGVYLIGGSARVDWVSPGTGGAWARIRANGDENQVISHIGPLLGNSADKHLNLCTLWPMTAGEYAELQVYQGMDATSSVIAGNGDPSFWAIRVA